MMTFPTQWKVIIYSCSKPPTRYSCSSWFSMVFPIFLWISPWISQLNGKSWSIPWFLKPPTRYIIFRYSHIDIFPYSIWLVVYVPVTTKQFFLEFNSSFPIVSLSSILRAWKNEHGRVLLVGSFHHDGLTVPGLRCLLEWARLPQKHTRWGPPSCKLVHKPW